MATSFYSALNSPRFAQGVSFFFSNSVISWNTLGQVTGLLQAILGLCLLSTSTLFLISSLRLSGQVIGVLSMIFGVVGLTGLRLKRVPIQLLFAVGIGFMTMLTFEFTVQVGRDVDVHCDFAETYTRLAHLEETMASIHDEEMSLKLYGRLNEIDDMLSMIRKDEVDSASQVETQRSSDAEYISSKLYAIRRHADLALDHLRKQEQDAADEIQTTDHPEKRKQKEAIRTSVLMQMDQIEEVLKLWDAKRKKQEGFVFEDYAQLIHILSGNHSMTSAVEQERAHLSSVHSAWQRYSANIERATSTIDRHRSEQRRLFEKTFHRSLEERERTTGIRFQQQLFKSLEDLPEQCLRENGHLLYFLWGGWSLIATQMITVYVTSTSLFVTHAKKSF